MFLKYEGEITNCRCDSKESAAKMQQYILENYGVDPDSTQETDMLFFDPGGSIFAGQGYMTIGQFEFRELDYDVFEYAMKKAKLHQCGVYRIGAWGYNLIFSEKTRQETLELLKNKKYEEQYNKAHEKFMSDVNK